MIGIVKPGRTRQACSEGRRHQKMYCGTCKMIGERYGQPYRMGLNHDLVLAAEVLGMLGGDQSEADGVRPRRCFVPLKLTGNERPLFGYIAALHLFWYRVSLDDHSADENSRVAGFMRSRIARQADQAAADLAGFGLDMTLVDEYLAQNRAIEQAMTAGEKVSSGERAPAQGSPESGPVKAAEPTARIIELVFRTGSDLCGISGHKEAAGRFGCALGRAIYLHDACIDLKKDHKKGRFNPFLPRCHRPEPMGQLAELQRTACNAAQQAWLDTIAALQQLPVSEAGRAEVAGRIHNTMARLARMQGAVGVCGSIRTAEGAGPDAMLPMPAEHAGTPVAPGMAAGACVRPGVAAATTAAMSVLPVAAQAQSGGSEFAEHCCSLLCCVLCCCPLLAFASEVAEGILNCLCDVLCCFSNYR